MRIACEMQPFSQVVQFLVGDLFHVVQLLFDQLDGLRRDLFHLFRQPVPFDGVNYDHREQDDEEQSDPDLLEIADYRRDRPAEKIARPGEQQHPNRAADRVENEKPVERHFTDAVEDAHREADAVDVLRDYDRELAELVDQPLDTRLGHLVKAVILSVLVENAPDRITYAV